jgi:hypothetical protein
MTLAWRRKHAHAALSAPIHATQECRSSSIAIARERRSRQLGRFCNHAEATVSGATALLEERALRRHAWQEGALLVDNS